MTEQEAHARSNDQHRRQKVEEPEGDRPRHREEWFTEIQNDELQLGRLTYGAVDDELDIVIVQQKKRYSFPDWCELRQAHALIATFLSISSGGIYNISFDDVISFRVLDENGLDGIWAASSRRRRPGQATFRARGHDWAAESPLVFLDAQMESRFSYFVATDWECLEVICRQEPSVKRIGDAIITSLA